MILGSIQYQLCHPLNFPIWIHATSAVTQLTQELTGLTIDTTHVQRFYNTIRLALRSLKTDTYIPMDVVNSAEERRYLLEYLIGEVMANRLRPNLGNQPIGM